MVTHREAVRTRRHRMRAQRQGVLAAIGHTVRGKQVGRLRRRFRHGIQLAFVHHIGCFGAIGDVDDLTLIDGTAD